MLFRRYDGARLDGFVFGFAAGLIPVRRVMLISSRKVQRSPSLWQRASAFSSSPSGKRSLPLCLHRGLFSHVKLLQ
jgi:hypothetical protein